MRSRQAGAQEAIFAPTDRRRRVDLGAGAGFPIPGRSLADRYAVRAGDRRILNSALVGCVLLVLAAIVRPALQQSGLAAVSQDGLERLRARMGAFTPDGTGVSVLQVETSEGGAWSLDPNAGRYRGITIQPLAPNPSPSQHADMVANAMLSLAPKISRICTASSDWFLYKLLGVGRAGDPGPLPAGVRVVFCAWVASAGPAADNDVLRRSDWLTGRVPFLLVAGQKNVSPLMGCAYNAISVGPAGASPNAGVPVGLDGAGRCKPEIVTGEGAASPATGRVAGAAAMLLDAANRLPRLRGEPEAQRPELLKAILLAGAARTETWTNLAKEDGAPAVRAATHPIDRAVGAGTLDVARAVGILAAGRPEPDSALALSGWDLVRWTEPGEGGIAEATYRLRLERDAGEFAIVCCWNRIVLDDAQWRLADIDLRVERLGGDSTTPWASSGNDASESRVDNVEMILLRDIRAGEYRVTVRLREGDPVPVAMAWLVSGPSRTASKPGPPAR
jgi:hypothetical protein